MQIKGVTNSPEDWYDFWYNSTDVELENVTDEWYDEDGNIKHE